jgi:hypothetical protein
MLKQHYFHIFNIASVPTRNYYLQTAFGHIKQRSIQNREQNYVCVIIYS